MLWLRLGWRNLWRNKARTLLQAMAIAGGLFISIFFKNLSSGSYEKMIADGIRIGSGHVGFYHKQYLKDRKTDQIFSANELENTIKKNPLVKQVLVRLIIPGLSKSSRESRGTLIMGVDIAEEQITNPVLDKRNLVSGEISVEKDSKKALIGEKLAKHLQVKAGKKIVLSFQDYYGEISSQLFRISGIFRTGISQIDGEMVFVNREELAMGFGKPETAHEIAVTLDSRHSIPEFLKQVGGKIPTPPEVQAFSWQEAMPEIFHAIQMDRFQFILSICILYFLVAIGAINTLLMSVTERTREFGLMRALGLNSRYITKVIISEAFVLALFGGFVGLVAGCIGNLYTYYHGLDFTWLIGEAEIAGILIDPVIYSIWDVSAMAASVLGMMLIVILASWYPARRALKIRPSEAMRRY